jgi:hypothetical protein
MAPAAGQTARQAVQQKAESRRAGDATLLDLTWGVDRATGLATGDTDVSGIYDVQLQTLEGARHHRRFALNVDPAESDLTMPEVPRLRESLEPLTVHVDQADQLMPDTRQQAGYSWSQLLFWLVVVALLVEQMLAFAASYHRKPVVATGGDR